MKNLPILWWLIVAHATVDFALQGDTMAREKSRHSKTALQIAVPWYYWLTAHSLMHGGAVTLITQSIWLGLAETACHWFLDFAKCEGWIGITQDQLAHIVCKTWWLAAFATISTTNQ